MESDFKNTVQLLFRRTVLEEYGSIFAENEAIAEKRLESDTKVLRQNMEKFELQQEKNRRSKDAVVLSAKDRLFELGSKELLLIEYFKAEVMDYNAGEIKINFHAFNHSAIVEVVMEKYQLESKGYSLKSRLRNLSFLNFNIGKTSLKKDDNDKKLKEIQVYLIMAGYKNAEKALSKHIVMAEEMGIIL